MKKILLASLFAIAFSGCQDLENAKIPARTTFLQFYEGAYSMIAAAAEEVPDGYVIAGTINVTGNKKASRIIVIKTDRLGRKIWQTVIENGIASNLIVLSDGLLVIGSEVIYNSSSPDIAELENYSSRIIRLSAAGAIVGDIKTKIHKNGNQHIDFYGNALTLDNHGNIISLGTYQVPGSSAFSYVTAISPNLQDTLWSTEYNYIVRDYNNGRSVHYDAGRILWGTSVTEKANAFNYSYLAIPVVVERSTFVNSNYFGQDNDAQVLRINELQKAPFGYCAVGTYSKPDGSNSDIFMIRVGKNGSFDESSIRYFDGLASLGNVSLTQPSLSDVVETGESLTPTRDGGFVLAGTLRTDEGKGIGNGGHDIWLIKIDGFGKTVWNRLLGGSTNERAASIRETSDGGLLVCGTIQDGSEQSGGLSSIFLMKTDSNGELKN